jgi:hypothetical protein
MKVRHYLIGLAAAILVGAAAVPALADDYFRISNSSQHVPAVASHPGPGLDDWFRDGATNVRSLAVGAQSGLVDDWFRDAQGTGRSLAAASTSGPYIDAWFRGTQQVPSAQPPAVYPNDRAGILGADPTGLARESMVVTATGFDWNDAGIGAASGFGLALMLFGAILLTLRHRAANSTGATASTAS